MDSTVPRRELHSLTEEVRRAFLKARRTSLFPGQLLAGQTLCGPAVIEMATGEGKTFAAALPLAAQARRGGHAWLATANDYLARRDAELLRPVFEQLGLTVGAVWDGMPTEERRRAYRCRVTYGTLREFAFDHLKVRLRRRDEPGSRGSMPDPADVALIVDECDSLLIDEARIPFVISGTSAESRSSEAMEACFRWASGFAQDLEIETDFERAGARGTISLTERGVQRILGAALPPGMGPLHLTEILHAVERALLVRWEFRRDEHYLIRGQEIGIVDDFTGRISEGRRWSGGIQQAIEARESLPLTAGGRVEAQITVQEFVKSFRHVSGMTGTATEAAREFGKVYRLRVHRIPSQRKVRRVLLPPIVSRSRQEKWGEVAAEAVRMVAQGRPVLVGTRTVQASEELATRFTAERIPFVLLNARNPEREAEIVAQAGQASQITIATNMAGRGTDIPLAADVQQSGGLHVLVTEFHPARRTDRQLLGRCARQGDPGSARFIVSLEDEILDLSAGRQAAADLRHSLAWSGPRQWLSTLEQAQLAVERRHADSRMALNEADAKLAEAYRMLGMDPILDRLEDPH